MESLLIQSGFTEVKTDLSRYKIVGTKTFTKGFDEVILYDQKILNKSFPNIDHNVVINNDKYFMIYDPEYLKEILISEGIDLCD